jgi:hypothetical protein
VCVWVRLLGVCAFACVCVTACDGRQALGLNIHKHHLIVIQGDWVGPQGTGSCDSPEVRPLSWRADTQAPMGALNLSLSPGSSETRPIINHMTCVTWPLFKESARVRLSAAGLTVRPSAAGITVRPSTAGFDDEWRWVRSSSRMCFCGSMAFDWSPSVYIHKTQIRWPLRESTWNFKYVAKTSHNSLLFNVLRLVNISWAITILIVWV